MKKTFLIIAATIVGVVSIPFIIGVGIGLWSVATGKPAIDCSEDVECLSRQMNTCESTKILVAQRDTQMRGIKLDVTVSAKKITGDGRKVCRVYMSSFLHKDEDTTSKMSPSEIASLDKIMESESVVASNKSIDSCDYSEENWKYIGDEMSTLVAGSLLDHPKAENCTALIQDLSKMTPEEYKSAQEGYKRLLMTGSSAQQ